MRAFIFDKGIQKAPTEVTHHLVYPYGAEFSYDDSLGKACIALRNATVSEAYAPGTVVFVGEGNYTANTHDQWVIVDSSCVKNNSNGLYNHTLYLCDITKMLERDVIGNKTFTKSIALESFEESTTAKAIVLNTNEDYINDNKNTGLFYCTAPLFQAPWMTNLLPVVPFRSTFPNCHLASPKDILRRTVRVNNKIWFQNKFIVGYSGIGESAEGTSETTDKYGNVSTASMSLYDWIEMDAQTYSVTIQGSGVVEIEWVMDSSEQFSNTRTVYVALYKLDLTQPAPNNPTLLEACNILANISSRQRGYDITVRAADVTARREMAQPICDLDISNGTLREGIDIVAGVVGCFGRYRLEYQAGTGKFAHFIDVRAINHGAKAYLDGLGSPILNKKQDSIEGACSALDSNVSNLINLTEGGALIEPSSNAWASLRAEDVRITEETAEIPTTFPIYRLVKVEVAYLNYSADITKYVVEKNAYSLLSSYAPAYPYSKAYALYYDRGQKGIRGLSFEQTSAVSQLLVSPAIVNICNTAFKLTGTADEFKDLGLGNKMLKYPNLRFRVSYIPVVNMRMRQAKPNLADAMANNVICYNQSATHVDSVRYGRNLAGTVDRSGQATRTVTYKAPVAAVMPTPGEMFDADYMISKICVQHGKDYKTAQMDLSKWYNRLNPFIGIDSAIRLFEISENGHVPRTVLYEDYCIISDAVQSGEQSIITNAGLEGFDRAFTGGIAATGEYTPQIAFLQGHSKTEGALTSCALPIIACGIGRSLVYTFAYQDNYSAGDKAISAEKYTDLYKLKEAVPYTDSYGNIEYVRMELCDRSGTASLDADQLPMASQPGGTRAIFAIDDLYVHKDSREQLMFVYQMHFVTPKAWIISPAIAEEFQMIAPKPANVTRRVGLFRLSYELSRTDTTIDMSKATRQAWKQNGSSLSFPLEVDETNNTLIIPRDLIGQKFDGNGVAWAVAYDDGKLLFGCNTKITAETVIPRFCLSFRHRATL